MRNLTCSEYVELVRELPPPTEDQITRFIDYAAHANSWYHAGIDHPSGPFHLFVDPHAGRSSKIPTEEYRASFGYLAYTGYRHKTTFDKDMRPAYIPAKIMAVGQLRLLGIIHTWSWQTVLDCRDYYADRLDDIEWPEESGGKPALEEIIAIARSIEGSRWMRRASIDGPVPYEKLNELVDPDLQPRAAASVRVLLHFRPEILTVYQLLAPERERQLNKMTRVIRRVCNYIEESRSRT